MIEPPASDAGLDTSALAVDSLPILERQRAVLHQLTNDGLFLQHLATRVAGMDVAVPRTTDGYHSLCAAYAHTVRPFVERQLARGQLAVHALFATTARVVELGPDELAAFDPDGRLLSNVNTPHDCRQACSRALDR